MKKEVRDAGKALQTSYNDTMEFLISDNSDKWVKFDNDPAIFSGVLSAVFKMIFDCAPNIEKANQLILNCLELQNTGNDIQEIAN